MKFDLYPMRDEKTVLKNPHKGWYWHFIDCGYSRPRYRDDKELIGDFSAFPGLNQLYLRFDMVDINPRKGVYDFSYLDEIMDEEHLEDIYEYFKESTTDDLDEAIDELGDDYTEDEIRLVRIKFISEMAN